MSPHAMAAKKEKFNKLQIEFVLDENQSNTAKATLVIECIKYLLYERHQIPTTVDQLFRSTEAETDDCQKRHLRTESKKKVQFLNDLKCLFQNLEELFASTTVYSILLVFGSIAVSPKECYHIQFLSNLNSINNHSSVSLQSISKMSRKFLRKLVMTEELRDFKEIPSTPLLVFIQTPRTVASCWFRPKHSFKVPCRGNFCTIILKSDEMEKVENAEKDLVWLQAPVTVKGYYEKIKDVTNVFSEFWEQ